MLGRSKLKKEGREKWKERSKRDEQEGNTVTF